MQPTPNDPQSDLAAIKAQYEELRRLAWWVVMNWDTESSQHHSMPALREAVGLPPERPTREEAQERLRKYLATPTEWTA